MITQQFPLLDKLRSLQAALTNANVAQFRGLRLADRAWSQAKSYAYKHGECTFVLLQDVYSDMDIIYTVQFTANNQVFNATDGVWMDEDGNTSEKLDGLVLA